MKSSTPTSCASILALFVFGGACNRESLRGADGSTDTAIPELCAGGDGITLDATFRSTAPTAEGVRFATEPGYRFLVVNANCEYWVNEQSWFTRHGILTDEEATSLAESLNYADLRLLKGTWRTECSDPAILSVSAAGSSVTCDCDCSGSRVPAGVKDVARGFWAVLPGLADQGENWSGPASVLVLEDDTLEDQHPLPWPSDINLDDLLLDRSVARETIRNGLPLPGVAIDTKTAQTFRQLMAEYAEGHPGRAVAGNPLPLFIGQEYYAVYLRDELNKSGE